MNQLMSEIENNFKNILSINPNTRMVALSIYVPQSLQGEEYEAFSNAIREYNRRLKELCGKYQVTYVDEEELGAVYNEDNFNFHINEVGHKALASILIDNISEALDNDYSDAEPVISYDYQGLYGVYRDLVQQRIDVQSQNLEDNSNPYLNQIYLERIHEKEVDADTCWQPIKRKK